MTTELTELEKAREAVFDALGSDNATATDRALAKYHSAVRVAAFSECAAIVNSGREWAEGDLRAVRDRIVFLASKPEGWKDPDEAAE